MELLLIKHGLLMAVIGTLAGLPFMRAISKKRENQEQWRIVHLAGILAGVFQIALGLIYNRLPLSPDLNWWICLLIITSNWLFTIGMILSGLSGKRGLSPKPKDLASRTIFIMYCLAALFSTIGTLGLFVEAMEM